jgi:hypothetical protein
MKYPEGCLRAEESGTVRFIQDFELKKRQKHQQMVLVRMSKTTKYSKGYLQAEEPSVVRFVPDFRFKKQKMASEKGLGPRGNEHNKAVSEKYPLQHQE